MVNVTRSCVDKENVNFSMATNLPVENQLPQNVGSIILILAIVDRSSSLVAV